jgi:LAS superfamily LD-carboxypeptidase LdcB
LPDDRRPLLARQHLVAFRGSRPLRLRLAAVLLVVGVVATPTVSGASPAAPGSARGAAHPAQDEPSGEDDGRRDGARREGEIALEVDVFRGRDTAVESAIGDLMANVETQMAEVEAARGALREAQDTADRAHATVEATEARIGELQIQSDQVVVGAYVNPPTETGLEALGSQTPADATIKQVILDGEATEDAQVLEDLAAAEEELEVQRAAEEEAVAAAEGLASDAEAALADLEAAQSQQALFAAQVQERLAQRLSEAAALEGIDPAMAAQIRGREGEISAALQEMREAEAYAAALEALAAAQAQAEAEAAAEAAAAPGDIGPPSGSLADATCPTGGTITVDSAMADNLQALLDAASNDGINMCGGGYRDPGEQIALREQNCGTSNYAIYEMPSSQCSPPTARPGSSNHEVGLAVDFTCNGGGVISSRSSPCFVWMSNNADAYGFCNLPSEAWHWSNDCT